MPKLIAVANIIPNHQHIERKTIGETLSNKLVGEKVGKGIAVIGGAARTGKTELVSQYYFDHAEQYEYCFWLRANSREELFQEIKKIVEERMDIPENIKTLKDNLSDLNDSLAKLKQILEAMSESWLLVIDDLGIKELDTLLPIASLKKNHHVIIMMTTETENADLLLSENAPSIILIPKFTLEEHQQLFAQRLDVERLTEQDQAKINSLIEQLGNDIDLSVIASRLYRGEKNRAALLAINKKDPSGTTKIRLNTTEIRRKLSLLSLPQLSNDEQLLTTLKLLSLFGNSSVPARWLPSESIGTLKKFEVLTVVADIFPQILLATAWQDIFAAELESAEADFATYNKLYGEALAKVRTEFAWTRTNYNKKLKSQVVPESYVKEQSNLAELSRIILTKFAAWQKPPSANTYPAETILSVVQLTNSLGRYHFIQEWFVQALEYYQLAKERFDFLLKSEQKTQLNKKKREPVKDEPIYQAILAKYRYDACLTYAQEVLHNIGATIVKISWDASEKTDRLNQAIKYLQLAFDWQTYLINHFDATAIPFIQKQLGLDTNRKWSEDEIKLQLHHFANFTQRVLAQAHTKQKHYLEAEKIYQALLILDTHYMDRPETKPLAYRDLANVQRRQGELLTNVQHRQSKLDEAFASIKEALNFFPADFPASHYPGEKEQVLYERAKIYLAQEKSNEAEKDFKEIIKIKSESLLYKAKTYYQLAKIADKKGLSADVLINYKNALAAISKRNPRKQNIYQQYYLELAKQFTINNEALKEELTAFVDMFLHGFMGALKKEKITLKFDPKGNRIQLGLGVTAGLFNIIPKQIGVTVPAHPGVTLQQDLPEVFNKIAASIADYRKNRNAMQLDNITAVENELRAGIERLANSLINQYAQQIQQLNERGKEQLADAIIAVLVKYITKGDLLTPSEGARLSVEEQLFKQLLNNLPKIELATKEKLGKWHAYGFFNGPKFIVQAAANSETTHFYVRKGEAFNPKYKYGYSMVAVAPIPTSAYDVYDSQEQLESAKLSVNKRHII